MRPVTVVVAGELGQYFTQMPLAEDQDVIQALAPERAPRTSRQKHSPEATGPGL